MAFQARWIGLVQVTLNSIVVGDQFCWLCFVGVNVWCFRSDVEVQCFPKVILTEPSMCYGDEANIALVYVVTHKIRLISNWRWVDQSERQTIVRCNERTCAFRCKLNKVSSTYITFTKAAATLWNSLPVNIINSDTCIKFQRQLKIFLCRQQYVDNK